jgi:DNA-binding transcriptional regulator GbsR (MarR family)
MHLQTSRSVTTAEFIEQLGLLLEAERFPRIAGRILGLLLATPEALSLDEIADALDVTKPSVSTNARLLEDKGIIERIGLPGDRRDHYRAAPDVALRTLQARVQKMRRLRDVLAVGREATRTGSRTVRDRFDDMVHAYDHVIASANRTMEELPALLAAARIPKGKSR